MAVELPIKTKNPKQKTGASHRNKGHTHTQEKTRHEKRRGGVESEDKAISDLFCFVFLSVKAREKIRTSLKHKHTHICTPGQPGLGERKTPAKKKKSELI